MLLLLILASVLFSQSFASDPEENMTILETIRHWNYPVEEYKVVTKDEYVLSMYRMRGRTDVATVSNASSCSPPILFVHGLAADSAEFVMNPPASSPAMILADAGFDVFLLNHRGSTYSKKHVRLSSREEEFWQFTLDEYSNYDATAAVDKILELSGARSLYWIGHSQGTMVGFMMLADNPEYNEKVKALFQMGPTGTVHSARGIVRYVVHLLPYVYNMLTKVISFTGSFQLAPRMTPGLLNNLAQFMCVRFMPAEICHDLVFLLGGPPSPHFNQSRAPVYISNYPCGTSAWNILHWAQIFSLNRVDHFDFSVERNMKKYGQRHPPAYNFSQIKSDVYLFWSRNDWMTPPQEIENFLLKELKSLKAWELSFRLGTFEIPDYNHMSFALATDNAEKVYNPIVNLVRNYESC